MSTSKIHSDQKYIDGIASNDTTIIHSIYKKFVPKVVFFVMNNSGEKEQAQDIVQEVMLLIFNQAKTNTLKLNCPFESYFFLLCKRKWITEFEKISNKGVTIHQDVLSMNESALELIRKTEEFEKNQALSENKFEFAEERTAFKANLNQIEENHFNSSEPKAALMRPWYYAVAVSIIILFGLFFFDYNQNPTFHDYNHPGQAHLADENTTDVALIQAEKAFNTRKFQEAISFFEAVPQKDKTPPVQYYYGVSLLEANQYKKSETVFNELKAGNPDFKDKSLWNLALLKLKQKDYKGCKQILQSISQDYENYDEVQELLDALD